MSDESIVDAIEAAELLASKLDEQKCEYAIGGALALGCWSKPRGTVDVDVTLFVSPEDTAECVRILDSLGAELDRTETERFLRDQGFCRVRFAERVLDVFLPIADFYAVAKKRRVEFQLRTRLVKIWDAETLCVFKMMFFRRKDLADVEQLLREQGDKLDTAWVGNHIEEMFGRRDPRVNSWREIVTEVREDFG